MQPIRTAFFSGTFNPVHSGHLILANYLCEYERFDEVWISVTPQNPLRERLSSQENKDRIEMLQRAVTGTTTGICSTAGKIATESSGSTTSVSIPGGATTSTKQRSPRP